MIGHIGRHRRSRLPLRLVLAGAAYVALLSTWSAYATAVMAR